MMWMMKGDTGGSAPGPRGLSLLFPGGQARYGAGNKKSDAYAPPSRKPDEALWSLLSVAISSSSVKHIYYSTW